MAAGLAGTLVPLTLKAAKLDPANAWEHADWPATSSALSIRPTENADVSAANTCTRPNMKLNFAIPNHCPPT